MARHGGRATTPGPGTGEHPATGTAPVPTPTAESMLAPEPTATSMIGLANRVSAHHAAAEVARAMAEHSTSEAEHAHLIARAEHWEALVNEQWNALCSAIWATAPGGATVERFLPVRPLTNGHVELHTYSTEGRRLVVLLTGVQALAVGAHLTAYGALSLDRSGQKLDPGLPHVKAAPPFDADGTAGQPATPDAAAGPPPAHP
ncbi:hypothetical protein [Micromonospora inaquosa]|uniref:Uncharacterized protein n=1 Tax=Micromonospora inaquosa TaxID=2203716 RepID=A0A3N9WD25_9ACTN|nr:hypothetical protein [Micromonospora inaquosa]RQW98754.1 hypothetical protein DLJ59_26580 [Micromonospora inaquosa]